MSARPFDVAVLHFGLDKTGSTAIQDVCDRARAELAAQCSLVYPPGLWHAQLGSCFAEAPARYVFNRESGRQDEARIRAEDADYLRQQGEWLRAQAPARTLLLSYEGFIDLNRRELDALRSHLLQFAREVRVLLYVRPPLSYAVSAMSQRVKMGRHAWDDSAPPVHHFAERHARLTQAFGSAAVTVRAFSRERLAGGDVVLDFFQALGVPAAQAAHLAGLQASANESLSDRGLAFGEALQDGLAARGVRLAPSDFNNRFGALLGQIAGQPIRLSVAQIERIQAEFAPHAEVLASACGIRFEEDAARYQRRDDGHAEAIAEFARDTASLYLDACIGPAKLEQAHGRISSGAVPARLAAGSRVSLPVQLQQQSAHWWRGSEQHPLRLCYHWLHADRRVAHFEGRRSALPTQLIAPGQRVEAELELIAPEQPGDYLLQLTGLQEGWCWFEQKGLTMQEYPVHVTSPSQGAA